MERRKFLVRGALAAGGAAAVTKAIAQAPALPTIRWRCASSFPKSLDTIYGGGEVIAKRVAAITGGKFQIRVFGAGEIVPAFGTVDAVQQIRRCLRPGGLLLCRVNSTRDVHHGAAGLEEIEPHYFRIAARYADAKRFFDAADLDRLFADGGWREASRQELTNQRYAAPKVAWELALYRY